MTFSISLKESSLHVEYYQAHAAKCSYYRINSTNLIRHSNGIEESSVNTYIAKNEKMYLKTV